MRLGQPPQHQQRAARRDPPHGVQPLAIGGLMGQRRHQNAADNLGPAYDAGVLPGRRRSGLDLHEAAKAPALDQSSNIIAICTG